METYETVPTATAAAGAATYIAWNMHCIVLQINHREEALEFGQADRLGMAVDAPSIMEDTVAKLEEEDKLARVTASGSCLNSDQRYRFGHFVYV